MSKIETVPQSFDAQVWAREFIRTNQEHNIANDHDTMVGWFANALMRGYDEHFRRSDDYKRMMRRALRKQLTDQEVLRLVESLVGDEFAADLEWSATTKPQKMSDEMHIAAHRLTTIYTIVHSHVTSHSCHHVHTDWRKQAEQMAEKLKESR